MSEYSDHPLDNQLGKVRAERDALRAQLAALTPYVSHRSHCHALTEWGKPSFAIEPPQCSCGLTKLLNAKE